MIYGILIATVFFFAGLMFLTNGLIYGPQQPDP